MDSNLNKKILIVDQSDESREIIGHMLEEIEEIDVKKSTIIDTKDHEKAVELFKKHEGIQYVIADNPRKGNKAELFKRLIKVGRSKVEAIFLAIDIKSLKEVKDALAGIETDNFKILAVEKSFADLGKFTETLREGFPSLFSESLPPPDQLNTDNTFGELSDTEKEKMGRTISEKTSHPDLTGLIDFDMIKSCDFDLIEFVTKNAKMGFFQNGSATKKTYKILILEDKAKDTSYALYEYKEGSKQGIIINTFERNEKNQKWSAYDNDIGQIAGAEFDV